jgi:DNA-binding PadR family transcriptional regulator
MEGMAEINPTAAVVLGLLELGPAPATEGYGTDKAMTGWQLHESARVSVGGFWTLTRSQIYLELERLAAAGLVAVSGETGPRRQQAYAITEAGRAAFADWLGELARSEARADQLRSSLALVVFFGEFLPPDLLRRTLTDHRLLRERRLEQLQAMVDALRPSDSRRLPAAVLHRGVALARLHVDWIDDVLRVLGDA